MRIPGGLLFIWGVFPSFRFRVSVATSQKKNLFQYSENGKSIFRGTKKNQPLWHSSPAQGPRACPIWPRSDKLCHAHVRI
jgi:hypothetical protein